MNPMMGRAKTPARILHSSLSLTPSLLPILPLPPLTNTERHFVQHLQYDRCSINIRLFLSYTHSAFAFISQ